VRGKLITASRRKAQQLGQAMIGINNAAVSVEHGQRLVAFAPPRCCREGSEPSSVYNAMAFGLLHHKTHPRRHRESRAASVPLPSINRTSIPGYLVFHFVLTSPERRDVIVTQLTGAFGVAEVAHNFAQRLRQLPHQVGMARIWSPAASCGCLTRSTTSILYRPARCCSQIFFRLAKAATDRASVPRHISAVAIPRRFRSGFLRDFFEALRSLRAAVR